MLAVEFFFSLSGFIFFWLYSERIRNREISAWNFSVLRFSRLYPLHLLTLLVVLAGQQIIQRQTGSYFVYPKNDLYHFVLNLFFASTWGVERGFSFNAPIWSVSIEILLYALFFALSRKFPPRIPLALIFVIGGFAISEFRIWRGVFSFFIGGIVYLIYAHMIKKQTLALWRMPLITLTLIGWITAVLDVKYKFIRPMFLDLYQSALSFTHINYSEYLVIQSQNRLATGLLFPITILMFAVVETHRGSLGKRISFIGNLSYSSYLIHFPLQLIIMIVIKYLGTDTSIFYNKLPLFLFFAVLIMLSLMSYRFIEIPAQRFLRKRLLSVPDG